MSRYQPGCANREVAGNGGLKIDPDLLPTFKRLLDPVTRGDPESPLRWTSKSTTRLAKELTREGHPVSPRAPWGDY